MEQLIEGKTYSAKFRQKRIQRDAALMATIEAGKAAIKVNPPIIVDNPAGPGANDVHSMSTTASTGMSAAVSTGMFTLIKTPSIKTPSTETHLTKTPAIAADAGIALSLQKINVKCAIAAGRGGKENELITRTRAVLGHEAMAESGGMYRTLIRENPEKFERVLADVECQICEGKPLHNQGGYFMDTWQRFK